MANSAGKSFEYYCPLDCHWNINTMSSGIFFLPESRTHKNSRRVLINFLFGTNFLGWNLGKWGLCATRLQRRSSAIITARLQFDPFSWAKFLRGFRREESQFPFTAYCLSIARLHQSPRQNHRDFACPAYVTEARTSLSPITVVRLYRRGRNHVLSLSAISLECSRRYRVLQDLCPFRIFPVVEIIEQTSVSHSSIGDSLRL